MGVFRAVWRYKKYYNFNGIVLIYYTSGEVRFHPETPRNMQVPDGPCAEKEQEMSGFKTSSLGTIFIALICLGSLAGCGGSGGGGRLNIQITDAPFPFDLVSTADVTIDRIEVHVSDSPSQASGWMTLSETPQTFNLLDLQGGVTATLLNASLPAGTYGQIRLHVASATVTLTDDRQFDLNVPSGDPSGIKINPSPQIVVEGGLTTDLILDFDVGQSFVPTPSGNPNSAAEIQGFNFKPVIRVVNSSTVGSIAGTVYDDNGTPGETGDDGTLTGATVSALVGGSVIASTATGLDGSYVLSGLPAGTYDVTAEMTGFSSGTNTGIQVTVANRTSGVDFHLAAE
jgi:hypothetical protein